MPTTRSASAEPVEVVSTRKSRLGSAIQLTKSREEPTAAGTKRKIEDLIEEEEEPTTETIPKSPIKRLRVEQEEEEGNGAEEVDEDQLPQKKLGRGLGSSARVSMPRKSKLDNGHTPSLVEPVEKAQSPESLQSSADESDISDPDADPDYEEPAEKPTQTSDSDRIVVEIRDSQEEDASMVDKPSQSQPTDYDWEIPTGSEQDENQPPKYTKLLSPTSLKPRKPVSRRTSHITTPKSTPRRKPGRRALVNSSSPEPPTSSIDTFFTARTSLQKYLPRITSSSLISTLPSLFLSDHTQVSRDIAKIGAASREIRSFIDRNRNSEEKAQVGKDIIRGLVDEVEKDFEGLKRLASLLNDFGPRIRTVTAQLGGLLEDMKGVAESSEEEEEEEELDGNEQEEGGPVVVSTEGAEVVTLEGFGDHSKRRRSQDDDHDEEEEDPEEPPATLLPPPRLKSPVRAKLAANRDSEPVEDASLITILGDADPIAHPAKPQPQEVEDDAQSEAESTLDDEDWAEAELVALFEGMESVPGKGEDKIAGIYEAYKAALSARTVEEVREKVAKVRRGFEEEGLGAEDVGAGWWEV